MRKVGAAVAERNSRSSPTMSISRSMVDRLPETLISLTGYTSSPCSIHSPAAPCEKSPVVMFQPNPMVSVKYRPWSTEAMISRGVWGQPARYRLVEPGAGVLPTARTALAAGLARGVGVQQELLEHAVHDHRVAPRSGARAIERPAAQAPGQRGVVDDRDQRRGDLLALAIEQERGAPVQRVA